MKMVILFGGGDGGGLIITEHGVRPIPPFDPAIRASLKSAAAMVNAVAAIKSDKTRSKMAKMATSLSNLAVEQVEAVVGPLDAERSLIFQDSDGGFTCGSIGKPPIPLPWPPRSMPSVQDFIGAGVIDTDILELIHVVKDKKIALTGLFEKPAEVAKKLRLSLSEKSAKDLNLLAPSKLAGIKDETDREIVKFFHKVLEDGRYMDTWYSHPYDVAQSLKFKLSDATLERLITGGATSFDERASAGGAAIVVGVAIVAVIAVKWAFTSEPSQIIRDRSGIEKI